MKDSMSHEEFENYLTLLSRMLQLRSGQTEAIAEELRLHLEERLDELTDRGVDPKKAVNIALGEFGDATALANQFTEISRMKRRRVMMRSMVGGVCVAIVAFATLMTVWPQGQTQLLGIAQAEPAANESGEKPIETDLADDETQVKLEKKIDADFAERPLNEVLAELAERIEVQFYVDTASLEEIGLSQDTPVTFALKNIPAEMALRLIFKNLGLSYFLDNGVIIVTTAEEMSKKLSVRMYDVKSLVSNSNPSQPVAVPMMMGGGMGVGMPGMEMQNMAMMNGYPGSSSEFLFINMIVQVIDPSSWNNAGGPGTLSVYRGILVVRQTESAHQEIEILLDELRNELKKSEAVATEPQAQRGMMPGMAPPQATPNGMGMGGMPGMMPGGGMGMMGGMPGGERDMGVPAPPNRAEEEAPEEEK